MTLPRCPHCGRRLEVRFDVNLHGQLVELVAPCLACPEGRRVAGICRDCPKPVTGRQGVALRCDRCRKLEQRRASRRYRERHPDRVQQVQEEQNRKRRDHALERHRRRVREREYRARPEVRARIKELRRRRHLADPEKINRLRRARKLREPEKVRAEQNRANQKRRAASREWSHLYQTKYVGPGKSPVCECGAEIPFDGKGRPHRRCRECAPETWQRNQSKKAA